MDKLFERFNAFDLFTMLIPGIGITTLFAISLSFKYYYLWERYGNEKYVVFIIFSYFCGVVFQELGTILDRKFLYDYLYGGNPREIFLLKKGHKEIINEDVFYDNIITIKNYIVDKFDKESKKHFIDKNRNYLDIDDKDLSSLIFGYCLNLAESKNLEVKSEKMIIISEMSRSLFWGCIATIILNVLLFFIDFHLFHFFEIIVLICLSKILVTRKARYEKYRIRILLRALYQYIIENAPSDNSKTC